MNGKLLEPTVIQAYSLLLGGDELQANYSLKSLQELILTPDYLCIKVLKLCEGVEYAEIDPY